jgi:RNA polymerase sigma-70 factor (ECF subfamily)
MRAIPASSAAADEAIAPVDSAHCDNPDWHRLHAAIRALPEEQREVLVLKIDGELTYAQIARIVGVSVSTAASRYQYALKKLKTSLAGVRTSLEGSRQ